MTDGTRLDPPPRAGAHEHQEGLDRFLTLFEQFITQFTDSAAGALRGNDSAELLAAVSETLRTQARELGAVLRTELAGASLRTQADVGQALRVQGAEVLMGGAIRAAAGSVAAPESLLGLSDLFKEIKKIIRTLVQIIFKKLPPWWEMLSGLLDELIDLLIKLLFPKLAKSLSEREVGYLRELYEMRRLQLLEESFGAREENDD